MPEGHATALARDHLVHAGWTATTGHDWLLAWTLDPPEDGAFAAAAEGRWINHVRGIGAMVVKSQLAVTLREAAARAGLAGAGRVFDVTPQTFLLPSEWDLWWKARAWDPDAVWIQKPADQSRGRGVALVTDPAELRGNNLVVQRYIADPHLLDGFKYSLRFYVLIASTCPLVAYVFDDGFTKLASRPFSLAAADRTDRFRHLTNPDVLRDDPDADGVSARNTTHHAYRRRLRAEGVDDAELWRAMHRLLAATLGAALPYFNALGAAGGSARGQFEVLGIDVAVDAALRPWLIECNLSPSLSVEASADTPASRDEAALKRQVVHDSLRLVGADDLPAPLDLPRDRADAVARLAWHDARRGGFIRLWPSALALETLPGAGDLLDLDRELLEHDMATRGLPPLAPNGMATLASGDDTLVYDARRERVTLLDAGEAATWERLCAGAPPATTEGWSHAVEWARDGWLAAPDVASAPPDREDGPARPRRRHRWNRERVYVVHGLRVALLGASPAVEAALAQAFAWSEADHEEVVDATLFVARRADLAEVMARINRLALAKRGGVVRRPFNGRMVMIGGAPFGAWIDGGGPVDPGEVRALGATPGEVVLELVSDGPGVVRALSAASLGALAAWAEGLFRPPTGTP